MADGEPVGCACCACEFDCGDAGGAAILLLLLLILHSSIILLFLLFSFYLTHQLINIHV
jgi:hypothetical protein